MDQLGIFAKYWEPGRVKTRLAADLGAVRAAAVYRQLLETSLERFATLPCHRLVAFTPADRQESFARLAGADWHLQTQAEGDLGDRMKAYFDAAFAAGRSKVLLIGSDSPTLPVAWVEQAFEALETVPVVLGPSTDGGYYLVGAAGKTPDIFDGLEWSGFDLWRQTVSQLQDHGTPFVALPTWYDVDEREDLTRLMDELANFSTDDPHLAHLREQLAPLVGG